MIKYGSLDDWQLNMRTPEDFCLQVMKLMKFGSFGVFLRALWGSGLNSLTLSCRY
jgi:hypothetical protein